MAPPANNSWLGNNNSKNAQSDDAVSGRLVATAGKGIYGKGGGGDITATTTGSMQIKFKKLKFAYQFKNKNLIIFRKDS